MSTDVVQPEAEDDRRPLVGQRIALVDDAAGVSELVARWLEHELGVVVDVFGDAATFIATPPPLGEWQLALVDLSFPQSEVDGLDILLHLQRNSPGTLRVLFTQGDDFVSEQLRDAWEAVPLATVLSKSMPMADLAKVIVQVVRTGSAPIDPVIRPLLPDERSPWRSAESYARLIQHAGHAKLWRALIQFDGEPSYRDLSRATGLSVNTVRNYREQLLGELRLHGLESPTMRVMQTFACRCRSFLAPLIAERLD